VSRDRAIRSGAPAMRELLRNGLKTRGFAAAAGARPAPQPTANVARPLLSSGGEARAMIRRTTATLMTALLTMSLAMSLGAGCAAEDANDDGADDEASASTDSALSSSATFNNADDHFEQAVKLPSGTFGIYDREGKLLQTVNATTAKGWIQGQERVETSSPAGTLYWLWGFKSGVPVSGYVRGNVISGEHGIGLVGAAGASNKNGRAAKATGELLSVAITPLPADFHHATTIGWDNGRPGDVNAAGQYAVAPVDPHYAYLTWSTPWDGPAKRPLSGGGIVRSLVENGATFHRAAVRDIVMPAFSADKKPIGTITWSYGFVRQNGHDVFGWMIRRHQRTGAPVVLHLG
jgi:hypothetical protein